ncbi:ATP-binding protein [Pelosinus sp. IPA-1]|uniref:ATP-binding protein n=1 Tax=Pelosinus sp. IPA-1 TaxID=3029569 RepID=UPI0024361D3C|nr:ATP-binding protein [Pelosinus sp. IPA-1]GMA97284.1 hypothetical protein PIPA1_00840 [Pelosinus sp. IPA-1]
MLPKSAAKRTYLLVTLLVTTLMILFAYYEADSIQQQVIKEKEKEILAIATMLDQRVPPEAERLLLDDTIRKLPHKERLALLHPMLQPVLEDIGKRFPGHVLGYGVDEHRLALYPPRLDLLNEPFAADEQRAIEAKELIFFTNVKNTVWGKPIVNVLLPNIVNGEVVWFVWVNTKVEDVEKAYMNAITRAGVLFFLVWGGALLILRCSFHRFENSLQNMAIQVATRDDDAKKMSEFPEMAPLLHAITSLRKGLEEECSAKSQLNAELWYLNSQLEWNCKLLDMAHDAIIVRDLTNKIIYWNNGASMCFGWSKEEALNAISNDLLKTVFQEPLEYINKSLLETGSWAGELIRTRKDGKQVIIISYCTLFKDEAGKTVSILEINHDITNQRLDEELFLKVFHTNPLMMGIVKLSDWTLLDVNQVYLDALGFSRKDVIGKTPEEIGLWQDYEAKELRDKLNNENGTIRDFEMKIQVNNETRIVLFSCENIFLGDEQCSLGMFTDITEVRRYEKEMAHMERMNTIGEMAAGIGHEVRNPLTTVRGYLQLFRCKDDFSKYHDQLSTMIEELDRANDIISTFLSLAKNKRVEMKLGNLNGVINELYPLLEADAFRRGHELMLKLEPIPEIEFDESEIRQLILNLVRNGVEAMNASGTVTISTIRGKDHVLVKVSDTGSGIPLEVMKKIGTPFFTTKEEGTGLGLAVCYRIANRHGAEIAITSGETGTTFSVKFATI